MVRRTMGCLAAGVFLLDRGSKMLLENCSLELLPGLLSLRPARNTGAALSLMNGSPVLITVLTALLSLALLIVCFRTRWDKLTGTALSLLLGGALGNLCDRLFFGYVIDFIDMKLFICNVADIAVTFGAILLAVRLLFGKDDHGKHCA
ncbi:MAG: signal peptidase II [Clostridia bacterium]|nr:signal peptidase II [Clostridia bacterium]